MADPDDIDHDGTDEIVCPWCGCEHDSSWEFFEGNRESAEVDCDECGKTFCATRDFSVTYSTKRKEYPCG